MNNTMRASQYDRYGTPDVLHETTIAVPVPTAGEVLVRVHATSVNGGETWARMGKLQLFTGRSFPRGVGVDFAGEVTAIGSNLPGPRVGDQVWGILAQRRSNRVGAAAEYVAVPADHLAPLPVGVDPVYAATLPGVGATALIALRDKARIQQGERLLVRGATGGVGSVAVQLGRALGAHVTAVTSAKNLDLAKELGADEAFDYRVTRPTDYGSFDVVLDTVGSQLGSYRRLLSPGGRMVAIAVDFDKIAASFAGIGASIVFGAQRIRFFSASPRSQHFLDLAEYIKAGNLKPVVDTVYPLSDIAEAHRSLEAGGVRGKHAIWVSEPE